MDLTTITTSQFKSLFVRDFPYLPVYDPTAIYNQGQLAFFNGLFFESKQDGLTGVTPVQGAQWNKVPGNADYYVADNDIQNAFNDAQFSFNQGLWGQNPQLTNGYLTLAAHYLTLTLRTAMQGLQSVGEQVMAGRGAGGINASYAIPKEYQDDAVLAPYTTTGYGMKYLAMCLPLTRGNAVATYQGAVAP